MKNVSGKIIYVISIGGVLLCALIGVRFYITLFSKEYIFEADDIDRIENCQNVIVLGSRVYKNGEMSGILMERALATVDLYDAGKVCHILISGDSFGKNSSDYDEVTPVKTYLIEQGVDPYIIMEDGSGFDTFHSMKNARDIFGFEDALVVTQMFHLSRAVFIGRELDMDTRGYIAYKYPYSNQWEKRQDNIREYPAAIKAIFEVYVRN